MCGGAWANTAYRVRGLSSAESSYSPLETLTTAATLAPASVPAHRGSTPLSTTTHIPAECRQQGRSNSSVESPIPSRCAELLGEEHAEDSLEDGERDNHTAGRRRRLSPGTGKQTSAHTNDDTASDDDGGSDDEGDDDAEEEDGDEDDEGNTAIGVANDVPTLLPYQVSGKPWRARGTQKKGDSEKTLSSCASGLEGRDALRTSRNRRWVADTTDDDTFGR